jgi:uncharacterized cupin superfamily protein
MKPINIAAPQCEYDAADPDGYHSGRLRLGPLLGASQLGASVYELPPGQSICPYHYEHAEEEWLIVLTGTPSLRHPQGTDTLAPWDVLCFPPGADGAHKLTNESEQPVRVLMFSTVIWPAATVYPDSDKIGVWTAGKTDDLIVRRSSGVGYWDGETGGV